MAEVSDETRSRRKERMKAKRKTERENAPDAIICPLCEHQIAATSETEFGSKTPYKGRSLVTHFKIDHNTNALGVDTILDVAPGTTQVCSQELIMGVFKPAGARGAVALAVKTAGGKSSMQDIEDEVLDNLDLVQLTDEDFE